MSLSLFVIEDSLAQLAETREQADAEGDTAAVQECDKALAAYLSQEAAKVDSYAGLIKRVQSDAQACADEIERLGARFKTLNAFRDRLKATALDVMQRFGVKELRSATNTLRRQGKGGLQALEVGDVYGLPENLQIITVRMTVSEWKRLVKMTPQFGTVPHQGTIDANNDAIRKALAERVTCPECKGVFIEEKCPRCEGTGHVARTIPGAKLLPRGEHLRVS